MLTLPFLMAATVGAVLFVGVAGALRAGQHLTRLYLARDTNELLFREELDAIAAEAGLPPDHLHEERFGS